MHSRKTTGSRRKSMPIGFRTGASSDVTAKPLPPQPAAALPKRAAAAAAAAPKAAGDTKLATVQREMADACNMLDCARTPVPFPCVCRRRLDPPSKGGPGIRLCCVRTMNKELGIGQKPGYARRKTTSDPSDSLC